MSVKSAALAKAAEGPPARVCPYVKCPDGHKVHPDNQFCDCGKPVGNVMCSTTEDPHLLRWNIDKRPQMWCGRCHKMCGYCEKFGSYKAFDCPDFKDIDRCECCLYEAHESPRRRGATKGCG
jgi:hypothetical protein